MTEKNRGLYILLISIHGLIRGDNLELGRDADTGGQTKYVVELARALGERPEIQRVDLLTRRIEDDSLDDDYAQPSERLTDKVRIVRIDCGEPEYIAKEFLWDSLDNFTDNTFHYFSELEDFPDIIHSHYVDAGYVGVRLSHHFSIPLVHTGHSLGRTKRLRLLASGLKNAEVELQYNMSRRIEAEEEILGTALRVITSTQQEIEGQYGLYDFYQPSRMQVIPPGIDLDKFSPPQGNELSSDIFKALGRFLAKPEKPIILAISRPDQRKNIITLIEAYGESEALQALANLVIISGNRDDITDLDSGAQSVLKSILYTIDRYDLYGKAAYPKHHLSTDVPILYRLAALTHGVFINPALTEPFGLTLIEAAASGVPIVATEDGGPKDIIQNCQNGYLIDPLDKQDISEKILNVLQNKSQWRTLAKRGLQGVRTHYAWSTHAQRYLASLQTLIDKTEPVPKMCLSRRPLLYHDRAIVTDLDQNLLGDHSSLQILNQVLRDNRKCVSFCLATGRRLDSAMTILKKQKLSQPDVFITSLGTELYYTPNLTKDTAWTEHIDYLWKPKRIRQLLDGLPGLTVQNKSEQSQFKISYYYDEKISPSVIEINHALLRHDQNVNIFLSFGQFLDIVPIRASKGYALRWFAEQWNIPLEHILVAGGSGADEDMMRGNTLAVVVANRHTEELSDLSEIDRIYQAQQPYAAGILEAIEHYDFFNSCEARPV